MRDPGGLVSMADTLLQGAERDMHSPLKNRFLCWETFKVCIAACVLKMSIFMRVKLKMLYRRVQKFSGLYKVKVFFSSHTRDEQFRAW